jgi:hypothetical protein
MLINPNTRTSPTFRTQADAELTKKIYRRVPVLVNESTEQNPWGVRFATMFHMSNDSHLFRSEAGAGLLPLYEGKMAQMYDHRAASVVTHANNLKRPGQPLETPVEEKSKPDYTIRPQFWIDRQEVENRLPSHWKHKWFIGFKSITSSTNERTFITTLLPFAGVGNSMPIILTQRDATLACCLLAVLNSLVLDFVAKTKVGGVNLNFFIVEQLPVLPPDAFSAADIAYIVPRVLELVYTAWDMQPFAADVIQEGQRSGVMGDGGGYGLEVMGDGGGEPLTSDPSPITSDPSPITSDPSPLTSDPSPITSDPSPITYHLSPLTYHPSPITYHPSPITPYTWDEERRALLRAELDARIARLYGLTRDELRYILDPHDVHGPDFPGETFRVLKEKETRLYGEYRTRRLVLAAWDAGEDVE